MAKAIDSGRVAACKTNDTLATTVSSGALVHRLPCLIDLPALTPDTQLKIFELIDETGSAAMAELVAALATTEAPAGLIVDLARMGVLEIDAGRFLDGASLVRRAPAPIATAPTDELPKTGGKSRRKSATKSEVVTLEGHRYEPSVFFTTWEQRGTLQYNPKIHGAGVYFGIFEDAIHVGMSAQLFGRLRNGKHVLHNGLPPHALVVVTDAAGRLGPVEALALERRMAMAVEGRDRRPLANAELPKGRHVPPAVSEAIDRLVEAAVARIADMGLAFTPEAAPRIAPQEGTRYRLNACGIRATAAQTAAGFVVEAGSAIRLEVAPSAGSGPMRRRHELLRTGVLLPRKDHFVLCEDLAFTTASGATAFVLGSRHHPGIWTALPPDPAPPRP